MGVAGALLFSLLAAAQPDGAVEPTAEQVRHFETSVRPLLIEQCLKCHGEKKQFAGLRLDSRAAILAGGDSGPAIVPGKPAESLLIRSVRPVDDDLKMPPKSKLSDRQIADLARWVETGAPFPVAAKTATPSRDPNHWAFQPPSDPPNPTVKNAAWAKSPLDNFIMEKIEAAGL